MRFLIPLLSLLITGIATAQTGTQIPYLQWDGTQFQDRLLTPANNTLVGFTNTGVLGSVALSGLSLSGDTLSLGNHSAALLTTGTLDIARLADASITNAKLLNSTITINGTAVSLGGSVSGLQTTDGTLALAGFASITGTLPGANLGSHSHAQAEITGLTTDLAAKADTASLGSAAFLSVGSGAGNIVQLNGSGFYPSRNGSLISSLNASNIASGSLALARIAQSGATTGQALIWNGTAWTPTTLTGTGDALTSGTLAQFAATTSTQLLSVISDESGTGNILTTNGSAASLTSFPTLNQNTTGSAASFTGTLAGDVTGTQSATAISAATVTGKAITGFVSGSGTVTATDTILTAINKLNGNVALKESALTFSTGLTRATNTISVNTSQNIATLSNLTSNGFVKTSGGTGALSIDTATYLTTTGNGSSLTGLTQSQISGLTTTSSPTFANVVLTPTTLTYAATTNIDFDVNGVQTVSLTGNITFTTSNRGAGKSKTIRIIADASSRTLTFPAGWVPIGAALPTSIAAGKTAVITVFLFGSTDADAVVAYAVQP